MKRRGISSFSMVAKVALLIFIFGIFPVAVTVIASNYRNKAVVVIDAPNRLQERAIVEEMAGSEVGGVNVLTKDQADTLRDVRQYMIGKWVSLQDKNYVVDFLPNNTFKDTDGKTVVAYGIWGSYVSSTSSSNIKIDADNNFSGGSVDNKVDSYYLTKTHFEPSHKDEKFSYEIMQLDQERAILYYTGNGKVLYFIRAPKDYGTAASATSTAN